MKILIINLLYIGDLLLTTPFLRALREALPEAAIDLIIEADYQDILRHNPNIDRLISVRRAEFRGKPLHNLAFIRKIRREHYDICINLHHLERTTVFTAFSGATIRGGLSAPGVFNKFFTHRHKLRNDIHVADAYLEILDTLNISRPKTHYPLELILDDSTQQSAAKLWNSAGLDGKTNIIGINPGSRSSAKRWPRERFAALALLLHSAGFKPVFFGGPDDVKLVNQITAALDFQPDNFAGATTLLEAAALIAKCAVFVSNDSAPMHFAAALKIPVAGIYGPSNFVRFHPYCEKYRVITTPGTCKHQQFCGERNCMTLECLQKITATEVFQAVQELLIM